MTSESGHAPNPFHGVGTLAICTPNHRRSRVQRGDWIIGVAGYPLRKELGSPHVWRLLHAMHIDTRLDLDSYFREPRFAMKRPKRGGSAIEACGDNFYCKDVSGNLQHTGDTDEHLEDLAGTGLEKQDIDGDTVFAGDRFWYFGRNAIALPRGVPWVEKLVATFTVQPRGPRNIFDEGREVDKRWSTTDLAAFTAWLPEAGGVLGLPIHWPESGEEGAEASACGSSIKRACGTVADSCHTPAGQRGKRTVC